MTVSILGQNISTVRPSIPYQSRVYKNELPTIKYNEDPKIIKEHTGKVISVCVRTLTGEVLSIAKGVHSDVCEHYHIHPELIKKSGWKLDNGNYVWR